MIVIAGMRAATPILVPFLFSLFLAILTAPPLNWLQRRGVPTSIALFLVILMVTVLGLVVIAFVGRSLANFLDDLPAYQRRLDTEKLAFLEWLEHQGIDLPKQAEPNFLNTGSAMVLIRGLLNGLGFAISNGVLILVLTLFLLLEAAGFPVKLQALPGDANHSIGRLRRIIDEVRHYMAIKTWISLLTGLMAGVLVLALGVNYPFLWGLLAFLLNYIPNIGSIIAAVPPVMLALVQRDAATAGWMTLGYLAINGLVGYLIEPRWMGRGLGLSTLVVLLSLVFWGWVLGPAGMLLSVPLTMVVKIALESSEETRWIAVMLGSEDPVEIHKSLV